MNVLVTACTLSQMPPGISRPATCHQCQNRPQSRGTLQRGGDEEGKRSPTCTGAGWAPMFPSHPLRRAPRWGAGDAATTLWPRHVPSHPTARVMRHCPHPMPCSPLPPCCPTSPAFCQPAGEASRASSSVCHLGFVQSAAGGEGDAVTLLTHRDISRRRGGVACPPCTARGKRHGLEIKAEDLMSEKRGARQRGASPAGWLVASAPSRRHPGKCLALQHNASNTSHSTHTPGTGVSSSSEQREAHSVHQNPLKIPQKPASVAPSLLSLHLES